jgi:low temperature requirement protein LtrA
VTGGRGGIDTPDPSGSPVPAGPPEPGGGEATRVSTLELFFDLVFVFTITQLTTALTARLTVAGAGRVAVMFGVIWWMYAGYAWLTNTVAPSSTLRRGLLGLGMAGFLTVALAIPHAFDRTGWAFGAGYFVVNAVHTGLFFGMGGEGPARAMAHLGPLNLLSASAVLVGGLVPGTGLRVAIWTAAFALQIASPYLHDIGGFTISPAHFVERHGLVVIVALGESIVAIGVGAAGLAVDAGLLMIAVLGLVLAYYLWWAYFGSDDVRAERALAAIADPRRRARVALHSFGYAHYPLLLGVVALAAGVKQAIAHPFDHLALAPGLALSGGVALFLASEVAFRATLGIGRSGYRLVAAAAALATAPVGLVLTAAGQLGVLLVVVVIPLIIEGVTGLRSGAVTPYLAGDLPPHQSGRDPPPARPR